MTVKDTRSKLSRDGDKDRPISVSSKEEAYKLVYKAHRPMYFNLLGKEIGVAYRTCRWYKVK